MKKYSVLFFMFICFVFLMSACFVEDDIDSNLSDDIITLDININEGVYLNADVSEYDMSDVIDYGFIVIYDNVDEIYIDTENVIVLSSSNLDGNLFSCKLDIDIEDCFSFISVRTFVKGNDNLYKYSKDVLNVKVSDEAKELYNNGSKDKFVLDIYFYNQNGPFNIVYNLNGGSFDYSSKDEMAKAFLEDFYDFCDYNGSLESFINGTNSKGYKNWSDYVGGYFDSENYLIDGNLDSDNDNYFFNSSLYKEKWEKLGLWVHEMNERFLDVNDYYGGSIDFYRYIVNDADQYASIYGEMFNDFPKFNSPDVLTYYRGDEIDLVIPFSESFNGWYLNSDLTGERIDSITSDMIGDIELFASWDNDITYEIMFDVSGGEEMDTITVSMGQLVSLEEAKRDGYEFLAWLYNGSVVDMEFVFEYGRDITLVASWKNDLENLVINGQSVKYRNSNTVVQIPKTYVPKDEEFRGVWLTSYTGDFSPSSNKETMKANLTKVLDTLEDYNLNAVVYHLRYTNNATYKTKMAPIASSYGTYETFEEWDYLEWFIEECHKRGIEFHAWLNPYRIKAYGYDSDITVEEVSATYKDYPLNAASNPDNILLTYRDDGSHGAILNPCKEEVQDYIVDVCLEIMENYNIDAIHFDDYFYAMMSSNVSVLNEPDQDDYLEYIENNPNTKYKANSASDKKQWRRDNIDNFIYKLHLSMNEFNRANKRAVQLGISPTGIYKNGNGSVESGSNTAGQEHYSSYLFCDTKKWVLEEWIDYIIPQTYWGFTHGVAGYADVVDWWNKVVSGTNVNLYTGMGIYMSVDYDSAYSWSLDNNYEASLQVLYNTKYDSIKGTCIFSYKHLLICNDSSQRAYNGLMRIKNEYWSEYVPCPKTKASEYLN